MDQLIVKSLTLDEALAFDETVADGAAIALKPIGLFLDSKIVAISTFGYPADSELRRLYTTQFWRLSLDEESEVELSKALGLMLSHYLVRHKVSDLFLPQIAAGLLDDSTIRELDLRQVKWRGEDSLEWINPNRSHYTYRLTAPGSSKYYYGVRTIETGSAVVEECLADLYFGSGGLSPNNKFRNWKTKHQNSIQKEIIAIYSRKAEAYRHEAELVGDLWKTDKDCLNSVAGGRSAYTKHNQETHRYDLLTCEIHGETLHSVKGACLKCSSAAMFSVLECEFHGATSHRLDTCVKCERARADTLKICEVHGETLHQGNACYRCASAKSNRIANCVIHGETPHSGNSCCKCSIQLAFSESECAIHGRSTFHGASCTKCIADLRISEKHCPTHGLTTFQGDTCARCSASIALTTAVCEFHGEVSFTGDSCNTCRAESSISQRECPIHGMVTHVGDKCRVCINQKAVNLKECERHGLVKHQGDRCSSCSSMETAHRRYHGNKPNLDRCHLCQENIL